MNPKETMKEADSLEQEAIQRAIQRTPEKLRTKIICNKSKYVDDLFDFIMRGASFKGKEK